jgi:hypothetical protein
MKRAAFSAFCRTLMQFWDSRTVGKATLADYTKM